MTAPGLANTGTIDLTGGAGTPATLDITAAAPATLGGTYNLSGDALLEFKSGGVTAIASGADLTLNGTKSLVALSTALTTDSAFTTLGSDAGMLSLENGALLTTTVGLTNSNTLDVHYFWQQRRQRLDDWRRPDQQGIARHRQHCLAKATTVTAASVANAGDVYLTGGTAAATLKVTGAFGNTDLVEIDAGFGGGGSILTIGGTLTNSGLSTSATPASPRQRR